MSGSDEAASSDFNFSDQIQIWFVQIFLAALTRRFVSDSVPKNLIFSVFIFCQKIKNILWSLKSDRLSGVFIDIRFIHTKKHPNPDGPHRGLRPAEPTDSNWSEPQRGNLNASQSTDINIIMQSLFKVSLWYRSRRFRANRKHKPLTHRSGSDVEQQYSDYSV